MIKYLLLTSFLVLPQTLWAKNYIRLSGSLGGEYTTYFEPSTIPRSEVDLDDNPFYPLILAYGADGDGASWEVEFSFRRNEPEGSDSEIIARTVGLNWMINFGDNEDHTSLIVPYIGIGANVGTYSVPGAEDSEPGVGGQAMFGVRVNLADVLSVGGEVRHFQTLIHPEYEGSFFTGKTEYDLRQTNLLVSVRLNLD